ncbi:phage tail protein [Methylopila sp. M107]|uniref:phage tail protein n=1 Tax=Methylopila sp. M107 TaxID=1101190 RepID=UPI0003651B35|nr:phage tail protein [Methylopila sp. M107]
MTGLIAVGSAVLRVIGMNPQRVTTSSETRAPGKATFGGMDYQLTGVGEQTTTIEAETFPHVVGGLDALEWLTRHHEAADEVNLIRLGSNYLGLMEARVVIRTLEVDEDRIHPFTGVGRRVGCTVELLHV